MRSPNTQPSTASPKTRNLSHTRSHCTIFKTLEFPTIPARLASVSTIAEIESAIARLPQSEVARLAVWLDEFRHRFPTPGPGAHHDLDPLIGSWREDAAFDSAIRAFEQVDEAVWK